MSKANENYNKSGIQYHIKCKEGDVGEYVLLPGDPGRIDQIAELLENPKEIAYNREYRTVTGFYKGVKVSATSTGIGCPSAAIAVEELGHIGVKYFIRVGSTAAMQDHVIPGSLIIPSGVHGLDGTSRHYVDGDNFSCVADFNLVKALVKAANELNAKYYVGLVLIHDAFYNETPDFLNKWRSRNVLSVEMESSVIYTLASLRGYKAGSVLLAGGNLFSSDRPMVSKEEELHRRRLQHLTALEGIKKIDNIRYSNKPQDID